LKEFQRLKEEEAKTKSLNWNLQRELAKVNYRIHTDAVKEHLIPDKITKKQAEFIYASEADLLNVALFGTTAKQWRANNKNKDGNLRDYATIEQLVVLANLESLNSVFIEQGLSQKERLMRLNDTAINQMKSLLNVKSIKQLKK
jgi:hypothetical protein